MSMYNEYFDFNEAPFSISPDPHFLYLSPRHKEALAHLIYGAGENGGFVLLTGQVGTGKTTLIRSLIEKKLDGIDVAICMQSALSPFEFIASVLDELHIPYLERTNKMKPLIDALNRYLLKAHAEGRRTVLVIDEAQNLSREVLERIRLLTNLETNQQKLLRIILVGQEELQETLARDDLRQLSQRITTRYHLSALTLEEVGGFVAFRLGVAGGDPNIFTPAAIKRIYQLTKGVPRLINVICDKALIGAYSRNKRQVSAKDIQSAAEEALPMHLLKKRTNKKLSYKLITTALLIGLGVAAYQFNAIDVIRKTISFGMKAPEEQDNKESYQEDIKQDQYAQDTDRSLDVSRETLPESEASSTSKNQLIPKATISSEDIVVPEVATIATPETTTVPKAIAAPKTAIKSELVRLPESPVVAEVAGIPKVSVLSLINRKMGQAVGVIDLLERWGKPININVDSPICNQVEHLNLICTETTGGFQLLKAINRPALIELIDITGESSWVTVTAIKGNDLVVRASGKDERVSILDIVTYWTGNFMVLLEKPSAEINIYPGFKGSQIKWLRQRIAIANNQDYTKISQSNVYDQELVSKVKKFQQKYQLVVDGTVGTQTLLYLYNTVANKDTPTLFNRSIDK